MRCASHNLDNHQAEHGKWKCENAREQIAVCKSLRAMASQLIEKNDQKGSRPEYMSEVREVPMRSTTASIGSRDLLSSYL
jgi:hypothetical protein